MIILKKQKDPTNEFDTTDVTITSDAITLTDILEDVKAFLMACGYPVNWDSDIVIQENSDD